MNDGSEEVPAFENGLEQAIHSAIRWLEERQDPRGFWVGRLDTNSSMEAEWILAQHFLGVSGDPKYEGVLRSILNRQRPDGSWEVFFDAPEGDISATVECYAALRCAGLPADHDALLRARNWILSRGPGGIRVFTKIWLALIGEWPWEKIPLAPPELILLPGPWFPFNIYQFSSWARATIVPLAVLSAHRPVRPLPDGRRLDELFPEGRERFDYRPARRRPWSPWEVFFLAADRLLKLYAKSPWKPLRDTALKLCLEWIVRHQDADGAWGGIQPPWIYSLMALNVSGYAVDHPVLAKGLAAFNEPWACRVGDAIFLQASNSPVWDTVLTLLALVECGVAWNDSEFMQGAVGWLLNEEVRTPGDWQVMVRGVEPSGWAFEYENSAYPDCDDTAVVLLVLEWIRAMAGAPAELSAVLERATRWMLAMQCSNGGWASFDKDNDTDLVAKIPFCDFGEVLDPPSVDVTGHVLEALGAAGRGLADPAVRRAVEYVLSEQEQEGSWFGRWGVNHIYGTGAVLAGLRAVGYPMDSTPVRRAAEWVAERQNSDGGWGETCSSYMDDSLRGRGPSTASQTGWALLALVAAGSQRYRAAVTRGVEYLVRTQRSDGTWDEPYYTGTGFPGYGIGRRADLQTGYGTLPQGRELGRGFMLNYNLYRHYFPLMALGRARRYLERRQAEETSCLEVVRG